MAQDFENGGDNEYELNLTSSLGSTTVQVLVTNIDEPCVFSTSNEIRIDEGTQSFQLQAQDPEGEDVT